MAALALWLAGPGAATALALEIEPSITVGEVYTSNVNLAPDGLEEDEWITRVVPAITLGYQGGWLDLQLNYQLEALLYAGNSDRNEVFNQLGLDALFDVIGDQLQFRTRGSLTQVNVTPDAAVATDNINVTGNRTDANSFELGPEWNVDAPGGTVLSGHLLVGRVNYDDIARSDDNTVPVQGLTEDIKTTDGYVSLRSGQDELARFTYELAYEFDRLDYEVSGAAEQQSASLRTDYRVSPSFEVFALGGLDSNYEDLSGSSSLDEGRWEAGFGLGNPEARVEAAIGERYWGTTWRFLLESVRESSTYRISYNEAPNTTDRTQLQQIPLATPGDPDTPQPPPDSGIDRYGNPSRFLQKRANALASWRLARTTLSVELFWDHRQDQIELDATDPGGTPREDETSYGLSGNLGIDIGARSRATLAGSWRQRDLVNSNAPELPTDEDQLVNMTLSFEHTLGARTDVAFRTGLETRKGTAGGDQDYDEYWANAELTRRF